ncbi:Fatty acyl-coa reductase [Globisporangium polare]
MKSSRVAAVGKRSSSSAAMALDATLISIKIVDTQPEEKLQTADEREGKAARVKRVWYAHQGAQAPRPEPQRRHQGRQYEQQTPLSTLLRSLIALVPNTIFACVSGALGLVGAVTVALLALLVLVATCVVQFFHEMALMLVETDHALLRFSTEGGAPPPARQQTEKTSSRSPGCELVQAALSLLSLSCDLLVIGFFKGTVALSYCCSLYAALAIPMLAWTAANNSTGSASELFVHQSFAEAPMTFVLLHGGMWLFALLWLGVTATMSQSFSHNLGSRR